MTDLGEDLTKMSDTERELTLIRRVFEKLDRGLIVVTRAWRVGLISKRAQRWLDKYFGRQAIRDRILPKPLQDWVIEQETNRDIKKSKFPSYQTGYKVVAVKGGGNQLAARLVSAAGQRLLILTEQPAPTRPAVGDRFGLTLRERDVLSWVAQGKTNKEIAKLLSIRPRTVGKHLEHVYTKIGVETRTSAATFVLSVDQRL